MKRGKSPHTEPLQRKAFLLATRHFLCCPRDDAPVLLLRIIPTRRSFGASQAAEKPSSKGVSLRRIAPLAMPAQRSHRPAKQGHPARRSAFDGADLSLRHNEKVYLFGIRPKRSTAPSRDDENILWWRGFLLARGIFGLWLGCSRGRENTAARCSESALQAFGRPRRGEIRKVSTKRRASPGARRLWWLRGWRPWGERSRGRANRRRRSGIGVPRPRCVGGLPGRVRAR